MSELQHAAYEANKEKIRAKESERYHSDPHFRMVKLYRINLRHVIKDKTESVSELLRINHVAYKEWIEYRFSGEMSFKNYGQVWEIDHVLPLDIVKTKMLCEKKLDCDLSFIFAWYNTMPKICYENMVKNKSLPNVIVIEDHLAAIDAFLNIFKEAAKIKLDTGYYKYRRCLGYIVKKRNNS
jgi:hypothetical protein